MTEPSVTINGKSMLNDFGLTLTGFEIGEPEAITHFISVPGRAMPIDATDVVYGKPTYGSRTITINLEGFETRAQFNQRLARLSNRFHNRKVKVTFDSDPNSYWMGRASVQGTRLYPTVSQYVITINAEPFKYYIQKPTGDYLWDDINFEQDILQNFQNITIPANAATEVSVIAGDRPLTPTVTTTKAMRVTAKGKIYSTTANEPLELPIVLYRETAAFSVTSTEAGTISITFRGESL